MKTVLIITDESVESVKMAAGIKTALKGNKVSVKSASDFRGNDLLPADVFFLGCEKSKPESFDYLADVLKHINLAGRHCGLFSMGSPGTVKFLSSIVKDSEIRCYEPLLAGKIEEITPWVEGIIQKIDKPE